MKKLILTESQLRDLIRQGLNEGQRWSDKKENAASFQSQKDDVYAYFTRLALEVITKKEVLDTLVKAYDEKGPSEGLADSAMGWSWKKNIDKILAGYGFMKCLKDYSDNFKNDLQSKIMLPVLDWDKYSQLIDDLQAAQQSGNASNAEKLQTQITTLLKSQRIFISADKVNEPKLIIMFGQFDAQKVRAIISTGISNDSTAKNYKSIWGDPDVIDYIEGDEGDVLSALAATSAASGLTSSMLKRTTGYQDFIKGKAASSIAATAAAHSLTPIQAQAIDGLVDKINLSPVLKNEFNDIVKNACNAKGITPPRTFSGIKNILTKKPEIYDDIFAGLKSNPNFKYFTSTGSGKTFAAVGEEAMGFLRLSDPADLLDDAFRTKIVTDLAADPATSSILNNAHITLNPSMTSAQIFNALKNKLNVNELETIYKFVGTLAESKHSSRQILTNYPVRTDVNRHSLSEGMWDSIGKFAAKAGGEIASFLGNATGIKALATKVGGNKAFQKAAGLLDKIFSAPIIKQGVRVLVPALSILSKASGIGAVVVWALYGSSFKIPNTNWIEASRLYVIDLNKFSTQPPKNIQVILDDYQQYLQESGKIKKSSQNNTSSDEDQ